MSSTKKYYINICIKMFSILLCIYSIVFILIFIISDIIYLISYCKSLYNIDYSSIIFNCIVYLLFLFNIGFISILCLINISKLLNCTKCNTAITHKKHSMDITILRLFFVSLLTAPRSQVFNPLKIWCLAWKFNTKKLVKSLNFSNFIVIRRL